MQLNLFITPGEGLRSVTIDRNATVADLVAQENLFDRSIIVDGVQIAADQYANTYLSGVLEVWATGAVKGA